MGLPGTGVKSVGKSRPYITNSLRLLKLPEEIRKYGCRWSAFVRSCKAIVSAGRIARQMEIAEAAVKNGLSVRQIEKMAQEKKSSAGQKQSRGRKTPMSREWKMT